MGQEEEEKHEAPNGEVAIATLLDTNGGHESLPTASCTYVYYYGTGPRLEDPQTAAMESMSRQEFDALLTQRVTATKTEEFIEGLRHAVLSCNDSGDFLTFGISPAVFTDDFVVRATEFVQQIQRSTGTRSPATTTKIQLGSVKRRKGYLYAEYWLMVQILQQDDNYLNSRHDLPLVMFTKLEQEGILVFLDQLLISVHRLLVYHFDNNHQNNNCCECQVLPLPTAEHLRWHCTTEHLGRVDKTSEPSQNAKQIQVAFKRLKALRDRGATKEEIEAERQRVRQARKRGLLEWAENYDCGFGANEDDEYDYFFASQGGVGDSGRGTGRQRTGKRQNQRDVVLETSVPSATNHKNEEDLKHRKATAATIISTTTNSNKFAAKKVARDGTNEVEPDQENQVVLDEENQTIIGNKIENDKKLPKLVWFCDSSRSLPYSVSLKLLLASIALYYIYVTMRSAY